MASSVKKVKKTTPQAESDTESVDEPVAPTSSKLRRCVICSNKASTKIVKNHDFDAMMQLYFCTLGIDVKPDICNKSDVCPSCFAKVLNYYETNDIIVYFETYFKSLRLDLLRTTLKGIASLEKEDQQLTPFQREIKKKYVDGPDVSKQEEELIKQTLNAYTMKTAVKDNDGSRTIDLKRGSTTEQKKKGDKRQKISLKTKGNKNTGESSYSDESE